MLPDRFCQMLTAYVDGELNPRKRKTVSRFLKRSSEARSFLEQLQADARSLGQLPRPKLSPEFASQVMKAIESLPPPAPPITPHLPLTAARTLPTWLGLSTAAAVLLGVAVGSFLYFSPPEHQDQQVAQEKPPVQPVPAPEKQPKPKEKQPRLALQDLQKPLVRKELAKKLAKEKAVTLELFCLDNAKGISRLKNVLEKEGVKVLVDPAAKPSLDKKPVTGDILVFAENIKPQELVKILGRLGHDKTPLFDAVAVQSLDPNMAKEVCLLLGVKDLEQPLTDPGFLLKTPIIEAPKNREKKEKTVSPKVGPNQEVSPPEATERMALVLARGSARGSLSPEIRQFLNYRSPRRGLQIVLILRPANA